VRPAARGRDDEKRIRVDLLDTNFDLPNIANSSSAGQA
jgi:hypothetical protein